MNLLRPLCLAFVTSALVASTCGAEVSQLWGTAGEKWSPTSRLPDFSFAGYRRGEEPFRIPSASISVADFGAKGDGSTDNTDAFKQAIQAGAGKLIQIPAGRFVLSDVLEVRTSNLVLRGAGADKTVIIFTNSLETLRPRPVKNDDGTSTTDWSWAGGLIMIGNPSAHREEPAGIFTQVTEPAQRGANQLSLAKPLFKVGDEVSLVLHDTADQGLVKYLYHDQTGNISGLNHWQCRQIFRIRAASGNEVTLDRGLRFDVRPEWRPTLEPFRPAVTDVGIEEIGFEFPATPYAGHFKESGWNPVAIRASAAHCWLKNLVVRNGDNGPFVEGAAFCTVAGVRITADPQRKGKDGHSGHHGITLEGDDCLCTNFSIETEFIHDLTVQSAIGSVFASGRAVNLCMDHHCWASYENLFTDIDAGWGKRLFASGGGSNRGLHTAAGATFWNLRGRASVAWPKGFGPDGINLIGLPISNAPALNPAGRWLEKFAPGQLEPADLHAAMLAKRLAGAEK